MIIDQPTQMLLPNRRFFTWLRMCKALTSPDLVVSLDCFLSSYYGI